MKKSWLKGKDLLNEQVLRTSRSGIKTPGCDLNDYRMCTDVYWPGNPPCSQCVKHRKEKK